MIAAELRGGSKPSLNEALGWIGSRVDDIYGANVGRLEDVWIDPGTGVPRWLLVKEGRFGGRTTLIPFEDATAGAGHVWVPYEREIVRRAPEIEPGAPLTHQVEASLRSHYAANAPHAISHRVQPAPPPVPARQAGRRTGSALGTATVRLHGAPEAAPPTAFGVEEAAPPQPRPAPQPPRRQVLGEQPRQYAETSPAIPPYQLPARPAPPVASPPGAPEQPDPRAYQHPPPPQWQAPRPPEQAPPRQQPGGPQWQGHPPWQTPQAQPQEPPPPIPSPPSQGPNPIQALQSIADSPDVHYVEIELSGELSIRGELRSVRVVPRR